MFVIKILLIERASHQNEKHDKSWLLLLFCISVVMMISCPSTAGPGSWPSQAALTTAGSGAAEYNTAVSPTHSLL